MFTTESPLKVKGGDWVKEGDLAATGVHAEVVAMMAAAGDDEARAILLLHFCWLG
jgi:hypothetical protein